MKFRFAALFVTLVSVLHVGASDLISQNKSLSDGPWAGFWNPAALNVSGYSGLSLYFPEFFQDGELGLTMAGFHMGLWGVGPHDLGGYRFALGTPSWEGFSLGGRFTGGNRTAGEAFLLYKPWTSFSLMLSSQVTTLDGWVSFAVKPVGFWDWKRANLFSLEFDSSFSNGQWTWSRLGAGSELIDGLLLQAGWRPSDNVFSLSAHWRFSGTELWGGLRSDVSGGFGGLALGNDPRPQIQDNLGQVLLVWNGPGKILATTGDQSLSIGQFVSLIKEWSEDVRVKGLAFPSVPQPESQAVAEEMADALRSFRKAGKVLVVRSEGLSLAQYRIVAQADLLSMHPTSILDLRGFQYSQVYWKEFFRDWGIEVVNFRSHDTKTAGNTFSETGMTDAERQTWGPVLNEWNDDVLKDLGQDRAGRLKGSDKDIFNHGPYWNMAKALEAGLVDQLEYEDEWYANLENHYPQRINSLDFRRKPGQPEVTALSRRIVVLYARGDILDGEGLSGVNIGSSAYVQALRRLRGDPRVAAVVLRIDSGGGGVRASQSIAREVYLFRQVKPLYVSMGSAAASGGYYIAAPAKRIFADRMTLTGSIGVLALIPQVSGLLEKLHLHYQGIRTSPQADFPSLFRPVTDQERELVSDMISADYHSFVDFVALNRNMKFNDVDEVAKGRVWSSSQALKIGLIDEIGGLDQTLEALKRECHDTGLPVEEEAPGRHLLDLWGLVTGLTGVNLNGPLGHSIGNLMVETERLDQLANEKALAWIDWEKP